jgi:hypothetical protein
MVKTIALMASNKKFKVSSEDDFENEEEAVAIWPIISED